MDDETGPGERERKNSTSSYSVIPAANLAGHRAEVKDTLRSQGHHVPPSPKASAQGPKSVVPHASPTASPTPSPTSELNGPATLQPALSYASFSCQSSEPLPVQLCLLPAEVLDMVMDNLSPRHLTTAARVNSAFYLAAKPRLFREVVLDERFHVVGPNHALEDIDTGERPVFRRWWMTQHTEILDVAEHHPQACEPLVMAFSDCSSEHIDSPSHLPSSELPESPGASGNCPARWLPSVSLSLPELPRLRTIRLPFDVHGDITSKIEVAPCGFHLLPGIGNLVHKDFFFVGHEPATTSFPEGSLRRYTAILGAPRSTDALELKFPHSITTMHRKDAKLTFVYVSPKATYKCDWELLYGRRPHAYRPIHWTHEPQFSRYRDLTGCDQFYYCVHQRLQGIGSFVLEGLAGTRPLRIVGLEALEAETRTVTEWSYSHIAYNALCSHSLVPPTSRHEDRYEAVSSRLQDPSAELFRTATHTEFALSRAGREALPPAQRLMYLPRRERELKICSEGFV